MIDWEPYTNDGRTSWIYESRIVSWEITSYLCDLVRFEVRPCLIRESAAWRLSYICMLLHILYNQHYRPVVSRIIMMTHPTKVYDRQYYIDMSTASWQTSMVLLNIFPSCNVAIKWTILATNIVLYNLHI